MRLFQLTLTDQREQKLNNTKKIMEMYRRFIEDKIVVPRAGLELATTRSSASPSTMSVVESGALPI